MVEGASRGGGKAPTDVAFYKPYLDVVWDAFGDDRLIYGSDWPVCTQAATYDQVIGALRTMLEPSLDADGLAAVFGGNAERFYNLQ